MNVLASFSEEVVCPTSCDDIGIGAFKKSTKPVQTALDQIKQAKKAADVIKYKPAEAPRLEERPHGIRPVVNDYLPNLRPGPDGKVDWTPLAAMTGTRPAVNKYSLSRYSLNEWNNRNQEALSDDVLNVSNIADYNAKTSMMQAFGSVDKQQSDNYRKLKQKAKDIYRWKVEVETACQAITDEVQLLEADRQRLKAASRVLMLPESISKECLDLRSNRFQSDLVFDLAEQELKKEMELVTEVRATLKETLQKIEEQLAINKAAKHRIEYDWCDKTMAYNTECENLRLNTKSNTIMFKPGAVRFGTFSAPLEYWEYFCRENVQNCEAARQKSVDLRSGLNTILVNNGRKLRNQADKSDIALAKTVAIQAELCKKLEKQLKATLQKIADMETKMAELQDAIRKMDAAMKLAQTRLDNRNTRPHGESVRDRPHVGLIDEVRKIHENVTLLRGQLKNVEKVREDLMKQRIALEKEVASKRMTLTIDRERCGMIRSHYPTASELAGF